MGQYPRPKWPEAGHLRRRLSVFLVGGLSGLGLAVAATCIYSFPSGAATFAAGAVSMKLWGAAKRPGLRSLALRAGREFAEGWRCDRPWRCAAAGALGLIVLILTGPVVLRPLASWVQSSRPVPGVYERGH